MESHKYINLPSELRLHIYTYLLQGLVYTPDDCQRNPQASIYHEEFRKNTNILCINSATRNEALPVLEKHLTVMANEISDWSRLPSYAYNAAVLRVQIRLNHVIRHLMGFLKLKRVDLYYEWDAWRYHDYPHAATDFVADLNSPTNSVQLDMVRQTCRRFGISTLISLFSSQYSLARLGTPEPLLKKPFDVDIILHFVYGVGIRKTSPHGGEKFYPCWYVLLTSDCRKRKILSRKVKTNSMNPQFDEAWTPVHEIAVLYRGLSFPILHHAKSGNNYYAYNNLKISALSPSIRGEIQSELEEPGKYEHALANASFGL